MDILACPAEFRQIDSFQDDLAFTGPRHFCKLQEYSSGNTRISDIWIHNTVDLKYMSRPL